MLASRVQPAFAPSRPAVAPRRTSHRSRASQGDGPIISEDVLARLKAAEAEAASLKKELAAAQAVASASSLEAAAVEAKSEKPAKRIDGGDLRRETLFSEDSKQRNWLSENDVSFFTGGGPGEAGGSEGASAEETEVVKRRLLLGLLASVGLGAFALVPTQDLALNKPSKPLFFYIVPLLRAQQLLIQVEQLVPEGDLLSLKSLLSRILGEPNNLQRNLRDAASTLPGTRESEQASAVAREVYEYVLQIDYDQYFESLAGARKDGRAQQQYYDFSLNSCRAAQIKLRDFLALMPADQREAAASQLDIAPF